MSVLFLIRIKMLHLIIVFICFVPFSDFSSKSVTKIISRNFWLFAPPPLRAPFLKLREFDFRFGFRWWKYYFIPNVTRVFFNKWLYFLSCRLSRPIKHPYTTKLRSYEQNTILKFSSCYNWRQKRLITSGIINFILFLHWITITDSNIKCRLWMLAIRRLYICKPK